MVKIKISLKLCYVLILCALVVAHWSYKSKLIPVFVTPSIEEINLPENIKQKIDEPIIVYNPDDDDSVIDEAVLNRIRDLKEFDDYKQLIAEQTQIERERSKKIKLIALMILLLNCYFFTVWSQLNLKFNLTSSTIAAVLIFLM